MSYTVIHISDAPAEEFSTSSQNREFLKRLPAEDVRLTEFSRVCILARQVVNLTINQLWRKSDEAYVPAEPPPA
jgi:hypothetical protein